MITLAICTTLGNSVRQEMGMTSWYVFSFVLETDKSSEYKYNGCMCYYRPSSTFSHPPPTHICSSAAQTTEMLTIAFTLWLQCCPEVSPVNTGHKMDFLHLFLMDTRLKRMRWGVMTGLSYTLGEQNLRWTTMINVQKREKNKWKTAASRKILLLSSRHLNTLFFFLALIQVQFGLI